MSIIEKQELDEQAKIREIERKMALTKKKLDKKITKQKIIMGAFFSELLGKDGNIEGVDVDALKEYTANHLIEFARKGDEKILQPIIDALSDNEPTDNKQISNEIVR